MRNECGVARSFPSAVMRAGGRSGQVMNALPTRHGARLRTLWTAPEMWYACGRFRTAGDAMKGVEL